MYNTKLSFLSIIHPLEQLYAYLQFIYVKKKNPMNICGIPANFSSPRKLIQNQRPQSVANMPISTKSPGSLVNSVNR